MIMQLLKQFFENLERLNPEEVQKMKNKKEVQPKFKYAA